MYLIQTTAVRGGWKVKQEQDHYKLVWGVWTLTENHAESVEKFKREDI